MLRELVSKWPKNHAANTTGFEKIQILSSNVIHNIYTVILLGFLFHTLIIASKSSSDSVSGDSMAIFIRLLSPSRFLNLVLISFISEKLLSTDAVPTGIDRQISNKVLTLLLAFH